MAETEVMLRSRDNLGYNIFGLPYDHRIDQRLFGVKMLVRKVSNIFEKLNESFVLKGVQEPTDAEKATKNNPELVCLWVGMVPKPKDEYAPQTLKNQAGAPEKGQSIKDSTTTILIQHDSQALRAAVMPSLVDLGQPLHHLCLGKGIFCLLIKLMKPQLSLPTSSALTLNDHEITISGVRAHPLTGRRVCAASKLALREIGITGRVRRSS